MTDRILLFIPMYNCEKQIVRVLGQLTDEVCEYLAEVIVVNNRSTDGGEEAVMDYLKSHSLKIPVTLLRNDENYGLGGSHKVAFQYALSHDMDYVVVLHGDDQGRILDLIPYLKDGSYKNQDCMLGARFQNGSQLPGYSKFRIFGNRVFNIFFSIAVGHKIYDLGSGLNLYSTRMLKEPYYYTYPDNLTFNCYMLFALRQYKQTHLFFPIMWREEDQVSNVKMTRQAMQTLKMVLGYFFGRGKFLKKDSRVKIVEEYTAKEVFRYEA